MPMTERKQEEMTNTAKNEIQAQESPSWTTEQLELITNTIARNATPDELKLFLYRCKKLDLDPLKPGQIHFVKYGGSPGTIVVGIEGFRSLAARSGKLSGIARGVTRSEKGELISAWAEVSRSDWAKPARTEVSFKEYNTGKAMWAKMPETMLQKVAECAALRMAFPDDLGGIYEGSEMDRAEDDSHRIVPQQPEPGDGVVSQGTFIKNLGGQLGRYNGRTVESMDPAILKEIVTAIESKAKRLNKPIPEWAQMLIAAAEPIIGAWENFQVGELEPGSLG